MIELKNGHRFEYMVASGALGFNPQRGWLWDLPLILLGYIKPELFTCVIRTVTRRPRLYPVCNLSWIRPWTWLPWSPWSCVRFLPNGGAVNKVGLYNPGIDWWCREIGPKIDFQKYPTVGSIYGDKKELVESAELFNRFDFVAIEVNDSCPNTGHGLSQAETIVENVKAVKAMSRHPIIVKVSVGQDYVEIALGLKEVAEAISLNSVPFERAFPNGGRSPLYKLQHKLKKRTGSDGGGGGVSGKPAQHLNWLAVRRLIDNGSLPVIVPSIMSERDLHSTRDFGAHAFSFGAIHLRTPWKPTTIVKKEMKKKGKL